MKTGKRGLSLIALLLIAGCATSLPKVDEAKLPPVPAEFKENWTIAAPAAAQPRGEWWKAFNDPVLDGLVERAGRSNASIEVAAARLRQARAFVRATDADRSLQVSVGASAQRAQGFVGGNDGPPRNLFLAGADLSYEVDLFGRLSHASNAATLDAQAREALLQSTRLLIQTQVAQAYLALRALDDERALVQEHRDRLPRNPRPDRAALARRRRRRARRGARRDRGRRHGVRGARPRPPPRRARARASGAARRSANAVFTFASETGKPRCRPFPPACRAPC